MSHQTHLLTSFNDIHTIWNKHRETLMSDAIAGATGAVAGAPQAMGFAIIAGVSPIYGLYTAIVATIVGAFTASSTYMTIAPTNAIALVVGSTLIRFEDASQIERLFVLTLLVGLFQLVFGVLQLGGVTHYFSRAVMTGFITGAGLLIINGQLHHITGYELSAAGSMPQFWEWFIKLPNVDWRTLLIGLVSMATIFYLGRTQLRSAAILTALVLTTTIIAVFGWSDVAIVQDIALIPSALPKPVMLNFTYVEDLLTPALAIGILALVQSAALTQSIPEPDGSISNVNRDFAGQGVANIASSFLQGMPCGGSLSRTAININSGAKTRLANAFSGVFIALSLLTLGDFIEHVPMAALAGQLIVAAISLIRLDAIKTVWRVSLSGRLSMSVTFLSALILPLEYSIYIGVLLSLAMYIHSSAQNLSVVRLVPCGDHQFTEEDVPKELHDNETIIITVYGNLYFAAVRRLEQLMPVPNGTRSPVVILRLRNNQYLGSTGLRFLKQYADKLDAAGGKLLLAGISPEIKGQLERTGGIYELGKENIFFSDHIVFSATERALEFAERLNRHEQT